MSSFVVISNPKKANLDSLELPSSKSISNRLLIIQYLSNSDLNIENLSTSDDTILLKQNLNKVKQRISNTDFSNEFIELQCKNAGTTCRFLISLLSITYGKWIINADERMQNRPIIPLIESLKSLGADIETASLDKVFPLRIKGKRLTSSKDITLPSNLSSQFISSMAMIALFIDNGLQINLSPRQVSIPYINMTASLMRENGADVRLEKDKLIIKKGNYTFKSTKVESDWSAAAFAYSIVALGEIKTLKIKDLYQDSTQGDSIVADLFSNFFNVSTEFDSEGVSLRFDKSLSTENKIVKIDFTSYPDLFLPLIATAVCLKKSFEFSGLETLTYKESDRLKNIIYEIKKIGIELSYENDKISFHKDNYSKNLSSINIDADSYNDHRIAMALSLFAFRCNSVRIKNPECVNKSFPDYWKVLSDYFKVEFSEI